MNNPLAKTIACAMVITILTLRTGYAQKPDCENAKTQTDINICAHNEYLSADKELNTIYKKTLAKLDTKQKLILVQSQRKWISFRDEYAKIYQVLYEGGSMASGAVSGCKTQTTRARIAELKTLYEQTSM